MRSKQATDASRPGPAADVPTPRYPAPEHSARDYPAHGRSARRHPAHGRRTRSHPAHRLPTRSLLATAVWRLFPFSDVVIRSTGLAVLGLTVLSLVPLASNMILGSSAAAWLHAGCTAALLASVLVVRRGGGSLRRALVGAVVLVDLSAVLFALATLVDESTWWQLLPIFFVLVTALTALTLSARQVWLQVGVCVVASTAFIELSSWGLPPRPGAGPTTAERLSMGAVALLVAVGLTVVAASIRALVARLRTATAVAEGRALHDTLTGALNRRGLEAGTAALVAAARRGNNDVTVIVADLDHFKRVNDAHGHAAGDAVLRATAQALRRVTRDEDLVARLGGEEFVVVARTAPAGPAKDGTVAWSLAERIRTAISEANHALGVTASIGAVQRRPAREPETAEWLHQQVADADELLYRAKNGGRNRSEVDPVPTPKPVQVPEARSAPRPPPNRSTTARERTGDAPATESRSARLLSRLAATPDALFPNDSPALRGTALLALTLAPLLAAAMLLNTLVEGGPLVLLADIGALLAVTATAILVLGSRRELRRVLLPTLVLLHLTVALFGLSQAALAWPITFSRLIPVLYVQLTVLAALTLSARAVRWQVLTATVLSGLQFGWLAANDWPWPWLELAAGTGFVLLVLLATAGAIQHLLARLELTLAEAEHRGETDALTALANRYGLERRIGDLVERARRSHAHLAVLVTDLDHFKRVNDTHSHAVGDQVLQVTARTLDDLVDQGVVARLGGEEFVTAALVADEADATALAERMRRQVKTANADLEVTTSVGGVHRLPPAADLDPVGWLHRSVEAADELLYLAKRAGRDRCVVMTPRPTRRAGGAGPGSPAGPNSRTGPAGPPGPPGSTRLARPRSAAGEGHREVAGVVEVLPVDPEAGRLQLAANPAGPELGRDLDPDLLPCRQVDRQPGAG